MPYVAHRIALEPNNVQKTHFVRACGVARFAYNWALQMWGLQFRESKISEIEKPTELRIRTHLRAIKGDEYPWMYEVSKCVSENAIRHLGKAFQAFFEKRSRYPQLKKKRKGRDSFTIDAHWLKFDGKRINIPKIGWVKMTEALRFEGRVVEATISRRVDRWFVSVIVDTQVHRPPIESQDLVGVDLGVTAFAALSTGEKIRSLRPYVNACGKMRRFSKSLSCKKKFSKNWFKAKRKLGLLHAQIADIRADFTHKFTSGLVANYETLVIEDLNVKGMSNKKFRLAKSVLDANFGEVRRQLTYKSHWVGGNLIVADRFFSSSKLCSVCDLRNDILTLKDREWTCSGCGTCHDRDVNAARNLVKFAEGNPENSNACGEFSAGLCETTETKLDLVKQESQLRDVSLV